MTDDLSEYAIRLAKHICNVSSNGLRDPIEWAEIAERFAPADREHMVEAAFELKQSGLLRVTGAINAPDGISHVRAEYELYWRFDQDVFNFNIAEDVATLIRLILEDERRGDAATLIATTNMTPRRFNPAFARIAEEIPDGRQSKELQPNYSVAAIVIAPEDRVSLKALLQQIETADRNSENTIDETANDESIAEQPRKSFKFKPPFFEFEAELPQWGFWTLVILAVAMLLFWQWPNIEPRINSGFETTAPTLISPANATTLTAYPRKTHLTWNKLPDAARYVVDVQAQDPATGEWFPHPFQARWTTTVTVLEFEFIGDQPGRWRVVAIADDNTRSQPSDWFEFFYESGEPVDTIRRTDGAEPPPASPINEQTINAVLRGCGGGWTNEIESSFRSAIRIWDAETQEAGKASARSVIAILDELVNDDIKLEASKLYIECFQSTLDKM